MSAPRHAFIATPSHNGETPCEYTKSLVDTAFALMQSGIAYTHSFCIGNALVHDARNRLVKWFLDTPATDLLFIDADIAWSPADAVRLIMSPHDVIGGAYRQKRDDLELYNIKGPRPTATDLLEVDYLGTGFLKISRRAVERLIRKHPELKYGGQDEMQCHALFTAPIEDGKLSGEDVMFCRRWRALGGKVFLYPDMTLHHIGRKLYTGNFGAVVARVAAMEKAS